MPYQQDHRLCPRERACVCGLVPNSAAAVLSRPCLAFTPNLLSSSLCQVLQNLGKDQYPQQSLEQIGTRIAKVLEKVSHPVEKLCFATL